MASFKTQNEMSSRPEVHGLMEESDFVVQALFPKRFRCKPSKFSKQHSL